MLGFPVGYEYEGPCVGIELGKFDVGKCDGHSVGNFDGHCVGNMLGQFDGVFEGYVLGKTLEGVPIGV